MKYFTSILLMSFFLLITSSCTTDTKEDIPVDVDIQDFIWKGLNAYYLWQENVPNLADTRFSTQTEFNNFLKDFNDPENLFESLIYDRTNTDKWSWIVDDYIALEKAFQGVSKSNGVEFELFKLSSNDNKVYGIVRYILPDSDASFKDISRGEVFNEVNGTELNLNNYRNLLFSSDSYTLGFVDFNNGSPTDNGKTLALTKSEYQENPVYITKTFDVNGIKIGYLMYNGFTRSYNKELNDAFLQLKNEGATELVLDLRYNGGGSVRTASYLGSMITGQFNGELFTQEKWNGKVQKWIEENHPDWLKTNFTNKIAEANGSGIPINNLNLNRLYVLTTDNTASASELIINSLKPYIDVKTIGTKTHGKYVASVTLYDSEDYGREGANPDHTWAMQPIVLEEQNKLGQNDKDGFDPDILLPEDYANFGILGDVTEPLLERAITFITTGSKFTQKQPSEFVNLNKVSDTKQHSVLKDNMFIERKLPKLN